MTTVARVRWVLFGALVIWGFSAGLLYRRYRTGDVEKQGSMTITRREMRMDPQTGQVVDMPWLGSRQFNILVLVSVVLLVGTIVTVRQVQKRGKGGPTA
jgi:hypothetical protein